MTLVCGIVGCSVAPTSQDEVDVHQQVPSRFKFSSEKLKPQAQFSSATSGQQTSEMAFPRRETVVASRDYSYRMGREEPLSPAFRNYVERGFAAWYGLEDHGAKTANGQVHDLYGMTAAHASLPFNTRVRVRNLRTGKSIVVTINDRLYDENVLIKLSYWKARSLGLTKHRSQNVEVRVIR
jgi:rare lipoprotein A